MTGRICAGALVLVVLVTCATIPCGAVAPSPVTPAQSAAADSQQVIVSEWMQLYLADISGGYSLTGRSPHLSSQLLGLRLSSGGAGAWDLALFGVMIPGTDSARWTLLPVYLHYYPVIRWRPQGPDCLDLRPDLAIDLYAGGAIWAREIGESGGPSQPVGDGYGSAGVKIVLPVSRGSGAWGVDAGAVLYRPSDQRSRLELSGYVALFLCAGGWL